LSGRTKLPRQASARVVAAAAGRKAAAAEDLRSRGCAGIDDRHAASRARYRSTVFRNARKSLSSSWADA
jgi:hypothetical protein